MQGEENCIKRKNGFKNASFGFMKSKNVHGGPGGDWKMF